MAEDTTMNVTEPATQAADNTGNADMQGNAAQGKTFTQEDVNGIVQSRISRMKAQVTKEARAEYDAKMAELKERELGLLVRETLAARNLPKELSEVITCTDQDDLDRKLDKLSEIYGGNANTNKKEASEAGKGFMQMGVPANGTVPKATDGIRQAMGLK